VLYRSVSKVCKLNLFETAFKLTMNTIAYLKEQKLSGHGDTISKISDDFKEWGIKVSYSSEEENRRVIFSATKQFRTTGEFDLFVSECNGLLLSAGTWEPLVIPPRTFKNNIKVDDVNTHLARNEYDIFEAQDGTIISLYYFDNSWRISTVKGFDVTYLKWNGKVYNQAFKEVLRSKDVNVAEFYKSLDPTKCYTFCLTHSDFHPFWQGKTTKEFLNISFVQSVNLSTQELSYENPFDLEKITNQVLGKKVTNVREIFKELPRSLTNFTHRGKACFGYILRFKDSVEINKQTAMYAHVFLESRLLQTIRKLFYDGKFNSAIREKKYDRTKYIITHSFLDKKSHDVFLNLFPQFQEEFEKLEQISVKLVQNIIDIHECKSTQSTEVGEVNPSESVDKLTNSAEFLLNSLEKVFTLNVKARDSIRNISTYVLDPAFIDIFYHLLSVSEPETSL
jgi:hypothetical protein